MLNPSNKQLVFVLYDSINNAVFQSQVLAPLLSMLQESNNLEISLVSFEKTAIPPEELIHKIPAHDNLHVIMYQRPPFIGKLGLWIGVWQLYRLLKKSTYHEIIARGPLAGWIATHALERMAHKQPEKLRSDSPIKIPTLMIQARGLCAEEYRYAHISQSVSWLKKQYHQIIFKLLKQIEFEVYRNKRKTDYPQDATIQAVSLALKDYLIKNFRADPAKIMIATKDIPKSVDKAQIATWRLQKRQELGIDPEAYVYCYSGSYKPWQCADQTIAYFADLGIKEPKSFLLILSQDKEIFEGIIKKSNIPEDRYKVISVPANDLMRYLAAADAGFLFREPDVINWVSRPTKMLEYQAVGLKIIHNSTVAWLINQ